MASLRIMRLAIFSSTLDRKNGYGNITYEYCCALAKTGQDFTLFLPREEKERAASLNLPFRTECVLPRYVVRFNLVNLLPHLKTIDVRAYDLVHSLLDFPHCFIAARSAARAKKPFIMGSQGTYGVMPLTYAPDKWFLSYCYERAKRIIVPSVFTKQMIPEYAKMNLPIDVIHNGVNFGRFQKKVDPSSLRDRFSGKTLLLTVGNFKERRGQDLVLKALAQLKSKRSDFAYLLVGGGSMRSALEAMAKELGLSEHVLFLGQQEGDELLRSFQACDIYIHTPRVFRLNFEGFGIVYLEASACGKPIIATDAGGIRDAVVDGQTGLVVPDSDVPAIAGAIERLLDHPEERQRLGKAGSKYAKDHDWSRIVTQFLAVYTILVPLPTGGGEGEGV